MSDPKVRAFLDNILAQPDDDTPRLIFADWLEERGDVARAEFIRAQVERATLPAWDVRAVRLRLRERELLETHQTEWRKELPKIKGVAWGDFRRGFVASATFTSFSTLREHAGACWAAAPVETIRIGWPRRTDKVESIAPIAGLKGLIIDRNLVARADLIRLADATLLSTLLTLNLPQCGLGAEGFRQLLASPHLGNLRALRVPGNAIGNEGPAALFDAASLTSLEEFDLSETGAYDRYGEDPIVEASGLSALATWSGMAGMRSLTLSGNSVGDDGLRALLRSPRVTALKKLILRSNELDGRSIAQFADARAGLKLDILDVGDNVLEELGPAYLATAPCLRELKVLKLDRCEIPRSAARSFVRAPFLASLRHLDLDSNGFGPGWLRELLDRGMPELHTLKVADNALGEEGVSLLAESPASDILVDLNLGQNGLGDAAAEVLVGSDYLQNLLVLSLDGNRISKPALLELVRSPLGQRLAVARVPDLEAILE
jgi:uncharacterized protein (TIGR02996 family)